MSLFGIPWWVFGFALWYAFGVYTIGSVLAAIVWDRNPLPPDRYWGWIVALLGPILLVYVLYFRPEDLRKGLVFTKRGEARLKKKVDQRYYRSWR
jgi:hypothetical protein